MDIFTYIMMMLFNSVIGLFIVFTYIMMMLFNSVIGLFISLKIVWKLVGNVLEFWGKLVEN